MPNERQASVATSRKLRNIENEFKLKEEIDYLEKPKEVFEGEGG